LISVSVIIPCYMDADTLAAALDSVLFQSRPVDEIIVVNDCSPQSREIDAIMALYPSVRYITNSENVGLAATRNIGLKSATTDIVSFLDADDQLHPQKIEFQLLAYESGGAVSCQVQRMVDSCDLSALQSYEADFETERFTSSTSMQFRNHLVGASMMIGRQTLLDHGGYDDSLRSCEDYDLWLRLMYSGIQPVEIKLPLYLYRINPQGLSRNREKISYWELKAVEAHLRRSSSQFLSSVHDGKIWAVWQLRHLYRYELKPNPEYRQFIRNNIARLDKQPLLRLILTIIDHGRLMKVIIWFLLLFGRGKYLE